MSTHTEPDIKHVIIDFGKCASSPYQVQGMIQNIDSIPLETRVMMFHMLMFKTDLDWPYALTGDTTKSIATEKKDIAYRPSVCKKCGGLVYLNPTVTVKYIKDLATALGLAIETLLYTSPENCENAIKKLMDKREHGILTLHTDKFTSLTEISGVAGVLGSMLGIGKPIVDPSMEGVMGLVESGEYIQHPTDLKFYQYMNGDSQYISADELRDKIVETIAGKEEKK